MAELIMTEEGSTPPTPSTGKWKVYPKADGWYALEDTGAEIKLLSPTITSVALGNLLFYDGSAWRNIGGLKHGEMVNGKIQVTVASNNITLALKTRAGNDPSATDPVIVNINGTYRLITSALSVTKNAGTNWFGSGSTELATKEIDYFVYLAWNTTPVTDVIDVGFARIPYARLGTEFSTTTTNEKYFAHSNASDLNAADDVCVIGRFAATLSATASFNWSVPTFTNVNLIQNPIFETRWLDWVPAWSGNASMTVTSVTVTISKYQIVGRNLFYVSNTSAFTIGGTPAAIVYETLPFRGARSAQTPLTGAMLSADSGGTAFGGQRLDNATPERLAYIKYTAANWAAGAGTVLNGNGFYEIA